MFYYWLVCFNLSEKNQIFFELDPTNYLSSPGYSWDVILSLMMLV